MIRMAGATSNLTEDARWRQCLLLLDTNSQDLGDSQKQEFIVSQFWRFKVRSQGMCCIVLCQRITVNPPTVSKPFLVFLDVIVGFSCQCDTLGRVAW